MKQVLCDRCNSVINEDDENAGQLSFGVMTEEWEIEGTLKPIGDFCGECCSALEEWLGFLFERGRA